MLILMEARSSSIKRRDSKSERLVDAYLEYLSAEKDEEGALYSRQDSNSQVCRKGKQCTGGQCGASMLVIESK